MTAQEFNSFTQLLLSVGIICVACGSVLSTHSIRRMFEAAHNLIDLIGKQTCNLTTQMATMERQIAQMQEEINRLKGGDKD